MAVGRLGTVEKALRVLEAVSERQPITVTALSRALGMDKSAVQRVVVTLEHAGWLRRDAITSAWSLDARTLVVGRRFAGGLLDRARPHLKELARVTGETVTLWVVRGASFVAVESVESEQSLRIVIPVGLHAPLTTAPEAGAFLTDEARAHLAGALPDVTRLAAIRERGYYVTSDGAPGTVAIGAPIHPPESGAGAVATVLIAAPASRMTTDELSTMAPLLRRTAAAVSAGAPPADDLG